MKQLKKEFSATEKDIIVVSAIAESSLCNWNWCAHILQTPSAPVSVLKQALLLSSLKMEIEFLPVFFLECECNAAAGIATRQ